MTISTSETLFDHYDGQPITKFSLTNDNGVTVSAISLGATLYEIKVPTSDDSDANLVLNYPHASDYLANPFYVSMAIGRTAGRIKDSQLKLGSETFELQPNEGPTNLHGGPHGFNSQVWDGEITTENNVPVIKFHHVQKEIDDAFPGDLDTTITYQLTEDNAVKLSFTATANGHDTVFNPTYHTYFNLGNESDILNHNLMINSDSHLEFDEIKVPTGNLLDNSNTPFDFKENTKLGDAIKQMSNTTEKGFDDIFKVNPADSNEIAVLSDPETKRSVSIRSSRNGLVVFTANSFTKENMNFIKTNGVGKPYEGIALEAQTLPDSTRLPQFGDVILKDGQTRTEEIDYHLSF